MDYRYRSQAKGIDRPSFGATLIKSQDKYRLSGREQAWLVGAMAYVPLLVSLTPPEDLKVT
jgi:hypothetical protein